MGRDSKPVAVTRKRVRIFLEPTVIDADAHALAQAEFSLTVAEMDRDGNLIERAFDADANAGDAFSKLSRYETAIERSLFRTLKELEHRQARRA